MEKNLKKTQLKNLTIKLNQKKHNQLTLIKNLIKIITFTLKIKISLNKIN